MTIHLIDSKKLLIRAAIDLGARQIRGKSERERALIASALTVPKTDQALLVALRAEIRRMGDPLGVAWQQLRTPYERHKVGAYYTPTTIVQPMIRWLLHHGAQRIVDVACGTGRFAAEVARANPTLPIVAIDSDPVATIVARATLHVLGAERATVFNEDFLTLALPRFSGITGYVSNPPYVRFQEIIPRHKRLGQQMAKALNHELSSFSGLHAYFYLSVASKSRSGDLGCFLTSAEWTENGYGKVVRNLMLNGLGGESVRILDPKAFAFDNVRTTASISCFRIGQDAGGIRIGQVAALDNSLDLKRNEGLQFLSREFLEAQRDWKLPRLIAQTEGGMNNQHKLGDLFRVSRGTATGANKYFVLDHAVARHEGLEEFLIPVLSSARELRINQQVLTAPHVTKGLLLFPRSLDRTRHLAVDKYIKRGEVADDTGAAVCDRTLARTRKPWWSVQPSVPPIVVSYMARKAPRFYINRDSLPILNIAHGLFPKCKLSDKEFEQIVTELNKHSEEYLAWGRTYHGNLKKFEPSEVEALPLPVSLDGFVTAPVP